MTKKTICVLGGSGFVGYHLINQLTTAGYRIRVPSRRRERNRDLLVMPTVDVVQANIQNNAELNAVVSGCDSVINLIAILNEQRRGDFRRIHVDFVSTLADICKNQGITHLLHMSALNADAKNGKSEYLRSKGEGEDIAHAAACNTLQVSSFRPSIIFGPKDHFFNMFATMLQLSPLFFPVVCPHAKFAPIYVEDIANVFLTALNDTETSGQRHDLCGPKTYTMQQLIEYTSKTTGTLRSIIPLGDGTSRLMATIMGKLPGKPFTKDNYLSMQVDSVCQQPSSILTTNPTPIEAVVPLYVGQRNQRASYHKFRFNARHES